ncbi:type VII secretion integral membrane protein EccD [Kitasatospora sp. LaBMicrA B282]|uniref:type VII secretion integral membrane protein EccD n=1 Tax=Kitasatospora sp. LaBMicrA B282 TaxID=3420949 RepID=UPI003D0A79BD
MGADRPTAGLSRVTLVGPRRRVDLVLPADEPVGRLLPEVLELLDDAVSAQPMLRQLVTTDGSVLPQEGTLADAGVRDGAVLRLVRQQDIPSAPVVHDVGDETADDLDLRAWRWGAAARERTAGLALVLLALVAGLRAVAELGSAAGGWVLGAAGLTAVGGVLAASLGNRALGTSLLLAFGTLGAVGGWALADSGGWPVAARGAALAGAAVLTLGLLGRFSPVGRGGLIGAAAVLVLGGVWEGVGAALLHLPPAQAQARLGAVLAVVSVVALGLLPRFALVGAGLTGLDDRRAAGASVSRYEVSTALAAAHRGLALATLVTGASAVAGAWLAVAAPGPWTVPLAAVTAVVLLTRARAFPLVAEVVALAAGGTAVLVRLAVLWADRVHGGVPGPLLLLCGMAAVPLVMLAVAPAEHVLVRLRRGLNLVETAGVVALFPLAVGVFGVYARLLGAF